VGNSAGYGGTGVFSIYNQKPGDINNPGDPDFWAYCIEHDVSADHNVPGYVGDLSSFVGDNYFTNSPDVQAKVLWIIGHSYPAVSLDDLGAATGISSLSLNDVAEGTTYAIWRFTELNYDADWPWETPASEAVYKYLVQGAKDNAGSTPAPSPITVSIDKPSTAVEAGTLAGPFTVHTNQDDAEVNVEPDIAVTDAQGDAVDLHHVVDGEQLFLDLRATESAGDATLNASVKGSNATGKIISVPTSVGSTPTTADHAQSIILVAGENTTTDSQVSVSWDAAPTTPKPVIGTTLLDDADQDHNLVWNGGTLTDTVAYQNLKPGTEYTVSGELMRKSDGTATGIKGTTTFTPDTADGTVEVTFQVPTGFEKTTLVAFESVFTGTTTTGDAIATHEDINDANQSVTVDEQPTTPKPSDTPTPTPATPSSPAAPSSPAVSSSAPGTTSVPTENTASPTTTAGKPTDSHAVAIPTGTTEAPGPLASTGARVPGLLIGSAALLSGLGIVLLSSRRMRRKH